MKKIIFFDIDGTLFDASRFLSLFYDELKAQFSFTDQDIQLLRTIYSEIKKENGYFIPSLFLDRIQNKFSAVDRQKLDEVFSDVDLFEKSVYKDISNINSLANSAIFGIFSQGEESFQKKKIAFLGLQLDEKNVYIFPNKLEETEQIFKKYSDFEVYLVDNNLDVLLEIKNANPEINIILIDRDDSINNNHITKIKDLNELQSKL